MVRLFYNCYEMIFNPRRTNQIYEVIVSFILYFNSSNSHGWRLEHVSSAQINVLNRLS